jgi:hypothetical protein
MVNHFATLLGNLDLLEYQQTLENYVFSLDSGLVLLTGTGKYLGSSTQYSTFEEVPIYSQFASRDFIQITLPEELKKFYTLLFPETSSKYYKEFLIYVYLRIISSAGLSSETKKYDSRVSYVLDTISEYFRTCNILSPRSNNKNYDILVTGNYSTPEDASAYFNSFVIRQIGNTSEVTVYSSLQDRYYKPGSPSSKSSTGMGISLSNSNNPNCSQSIAIGNTGLSFTISGPFNDGEFGFINTANKVWTFEVTAPFSFSFKNKLDQLKASEHTVDNMLNFSRDLCTGSYENLWTSHFNDAYKFAGLLLAYVERVNLVWQNKAM